MPGQANTCSITTAPANNWPRLVAMIVSTGMSELRSACRTTTRRGPAPLASAVRT
jgi:hypothetical protein